MEQAPFVGRAAALERLTAALAAAGSGRGSTVLVGGEAGIGTSRVAAELAARARREGWLVLAGRCIDLIASRPAAPAADHRAAPGPNGQRHRPPTAGRGRAGGPPR